MKKTIYCIIFWIFVPLAAGYLINFLCNLDFDVSLKWVQGLWTIGCIAAIIWVVNKVKGVL